MSHSDASLEVESCLTRLSQIHLPTEVVKHHISIVLLLLGYYLMEEDIISFD